MATKLKAAEICMRSGTDMMIVNGERPDILYRVLDGENVGTRFIGRKQP
jgi:glutamate 5-kinase